MQELWLAGIKDPALLTSACFLLLEISDCWLAINLQTSLQIIIWGPACKPASPSLLLPNLSTCLVLLHMPKTDLAGGTITCVGFVCHQYYAKKLLKWFLLGDGWRRGRGKKEPMKPLELHVNKRWCVKIFWVSLYILKWSLFSSFLIYLPGNYGWSSFAFIQVLF